MTQTTEPQPGPQNALEQAMAEAKAGRLPTDAFLRLLLNTAVLIPSRREVLADGSGLSPLLPEREGVSYAALFTSPPRLEAVKGLAPFCLEMVASAFLARLPEGVGMVVNPGSTLGLEIAPHGVREILRDLMPEDKP